MHVDVTLQIGFGDEVGQGACFGGFNFAVVFAQLGGMNLRPSLL